MAKNITMPESFVNDVYALLWYLDGVSIPEEARARCRALQGAIDAKLRAREKREAFSAYKSAAAGSEEREQRRREYLDRAGVHRDWRTVNESHL
jgi:hypothetical protein